jgi:hypothetical protein
MALATKPIKNEASETMEIAMTYDDPALEATPIVACEAPGIGRRSAAT